MPSGSKQSSSMYCAIADDFVYVSAAFAEQTRSHSARDARIGAAIVRW